jgi:hypothetical protein
VYVNETEKGSFFKVLNCYNSFKFLAVKFVRIGGAGTPEDEKIRRLDRLITGRAGWRVFLRF